MRLESVGNLQTVNVCVTLLLVFWSSWLVMKHWRLWASVMSGIKQRQHFWEETQCAHRRIRLSNRYSSCWTCHQFGAGTRFALLSNTELVSNTCCSGGSWGPSVWGPIIRGGGLVGKGHPKSSTGAVARSCKGTNGKFQSGAPTARSPRLHAWRHFLQAAGTTSSWTNNCW